MYGIIRFIRAPGIRSPQENGDIAVRPACAAANSQLPGVARARGDHRGPGVSSCLLFPRACEQRAGVGLYRHAPRSWLPQRTTLVAGPAAAAGRRTGQSHHPVPARHRRPLAGGRVQSRRRSAAPTELIGSGAGSTSEPQSGRSARTRGAGDRARRRDAGARARPWPARSGSRLADVHRAQILDRTRYVLASHPHLPAAARPDIAQFGWVLAIGLLAATLGCGIRWLGPFITHAASYTAGAWCC